MPTIRVDRLALIRALRNLVDNALKHGGKGLREIMVDYGSDPDFHILSVSDDGVGVDPDLSERLFERYFRKPSSPTKPGTGLGLAIVKSVAERHGGRAWVESRAEGGAVFYFSISKAI